VRKLLLLSLLLVACDGSGLDGSGGREADATSATTNATTSDTTDDTRAPDVAAPPVLAGEADLGAVTPPPPASTTPLPSGTTDGSGLVVAKDQLTGRFLFGVGASPDGLIASLGGGAGGLTPIRAGVQLVPGDDGHGTFEVRAFGAALLDQSADGLIESYPYSDVDADTIRVDFAGATSTLQIALSAQCYYAQSSYALQQAPVYADGLLTWAASETYSRKGGCSWAPRDAEGLHVHYLRHESAGRDFKARVADSEQPFGFFLAGNDRTPTLARLPGLTRDEPAKTYTYYLSTSFPEAMVSAAEDTFEAWNDALEAIIGRRPFVVARATADMIAWDPRYHVVLWDASGGSGAIAPFTTDPDSGEIFQSFVVMYFGDIDSVIHEYQDFFGKHPDVQAELVPVPTPQALPSHPGFELPALPIGRAERPLDVPARALTPRAFVRRPFRPSDVRATMTHYRQLGVDLSEAEVEHIVVIDFLLHELGHNLGLRHNFIGSVDQHRLSAAHSASTTMDYVIGMLTPGSYDRDAMRYAYGATPPSKVDYLYCTDETLELVPACKQWDYGHPIRDELDVIDAILAAYPPSASNGTLNGLFDQGTLDEELTRARALVNTTYEDWDETPVMTFEELLGRVDCGADCPSHVRLRNDIALYLLYAKHGVVAYWLPNYPQVYLDFPALDDTQSARVMDTYYRLVTDPAEPLTLKTTIVAKLPTSAVLGAVDLLHGLDGYFAALATPSADELAVKQAIATALSAL